MTSAPAPSVPYHRQHPPRDRTLAQVGVAVAVLIGGALAALGALSLGSLGKSLCWVPVILAATLVVAIHRNHTREAGDAADRSTQDGDRRSWPSAWAPVEPGSAVMNTTC
jgi:hypothetical protein